MNNEISIREFSTTDLNALGDFITSGTWPFHSNQLTLPLTTDYFCKESKTLVAGRDAELLGYIRITEFIDGDSPLFDLRVALKARGQGIGTALVTTATTTVFSELTHTVRFEATTRIDNLPMIDLLEKLGWTKEAHYRKAWRLPNHQFCEALGYAILREEWEKVLK